MRSLLLIIAFLTWAGPAWSKGVLRVSDAREMRDTSLLDYVTYLNDTEGNLKAAQLVELPQRDLFRPIENFGVQIHSSHPVWVRLRLEIATEKAAELLLRSTASYLDRIDLYQARPEQPPLLLASHGDRLVIDNNYRLPLFPLRLEPGTYTFYIRIESAGPLNLKFDLWDKATFDEKERGFEYAWLGLLFGFVLVMAAYNTFLAIRLANPTYFIYVAYITLFAGVQFCITGLAQHLLPSHPLKIFYVNEGLPLQAELCAIFASLFAASFLGLKEFTPRLYRAMQIFFVLSCLNMLLCLVNFNLSITIVLLTNSYISSLLLYAGIRRCLDGYRPAYFYTAAWLFIIIGSMFTMGRIYGLLPDNTFTAWSQFLGGVIEVILLSLALGDKLSLEKEKSHKQISKLNSDLHFVNARLKQHIENTEAIIDEKTRDIRSMMDHIPIGVFMIKADLSIHKDYSHSLEGFFPNHNILSMQATELLFTNSSHTSDERSQVLSALRATLGEDAIAFDLNSHVFPLNLERNVRGMERQVFDLTWNTIDDGTGKVDKVLVTIRDVTEVRRLQSKAADQQIELDYIGEILNIPKMRFIRFLKSSHELIDESQKFLASLSSREQHGESLKHLFIMMHTLKGSARALYLRNMTRVFHEAEQYFHQLQADASVPWDAEGLGSKLEMARKIVGRYEKIAREKLNYSFEPTSTLEFPFEQVAEMDKRLGQLGGMQHSSPEMETQIQGIRSILHRKLFKPAREILTEILAIVPSLAHELQKENPRLDIEASGILVSEPAEELFRNIFVHLLQNSLDHGIEDAQERRNARKDEVGTIRLTLERRSDRCLLQYEDDGRGLDIKAIAAFRRDHGQASAPEEIAALIFEMGISTASVVSEISGRGVGMGAIKAFVERHGGILSLRLKQKVDAGSRYHPFSIVVDLPFAQLFEEQVEENPSQVA